MKLSTLIICTAYATLGIVLGTTELHFSDWQFWAISGCAVIIGTFSAIAAMERK